MSHDRTGLPGSDEERFISRIDCRFPYGDLEQGLALVREACGIGPNCAFMVLHELARPGHGHRALVSDRLAVLDFMAAQFQHPLAPMIIELTRRLILGEHGSVAEALDAMRAVALHPHQHNALAIASSWADAWSEELEREEERIVAEWAAS